VQAVTEICCASYRTSFTIGLVISISVTVNVE
jgi:hypothetical protein